MTGSTNTTDSSGRAAHWNGRYDQIGATAVSWYQPTPTVSLQLLDLLGTEPSDSVIDVGGGASTLVDNLVRRGHRDLAVLDVSAVALAVARDRLRAAAADDGPAVGSDAATQQPEVRVDWIEHDLLTWTPARRWDVWHDRAVLHFLVDETERRAYLELVRRAVRPGGAVVIGTFATDGPTHCSALPVRRYDAAELRSLFGDCEIVHEMRAVHLTPNDAEQPFQWVALRLPGLPDPHD